MKFCKSRSYFSIRCEVSAIDGGYRRVNNLQLLSAGHVLVALQFAFDLVRNSDKFVLRLLGPGLNAL